MVLPVAVLFAVLAGCASAPPDSAHAPAPAAASSSAARPHPSSTPSALPSSPLVLSPPPPPPLRPSRIRLGEAQAEYLEPSIELMPGGQSVLLVSQHADRPFAFARRYGGAEKEIGPVLRFGGEYVVGAFDVKTGQEATLAVATSDGSRLCISQFEPGADKAKSRVCNALSPAFVVQIGTKIAFVETEFERPPESAQKTATPAKNPPAAQKPPAKTNKKPAKKTNKKPAKKTTKKTKSPKKPNPKTQKAPKKPSSAPKKPKEFINIRLRFTDPDGQAETDSLLTGLRFQKVLDGLNLIDAQGHPNGVDLLWYEPSEKPIALPKSSMGRARIAGGSLGPDGHFDPKSAVPVVEGDLEYTGIAGHHDGRLYRTPSAATFIGLTGRPGGCESVRIAPALSLIQANAAYCAVAPERMAERKGVATAQELAVFQALLTQEPRRRHGQPQNDPGLAAWAGDRGFFVSFSPSGEELRALSLTDGKTVPIEQPFVAHRSHLKWGALSADGIDALAMLSGKLSHIDAQGHVTPIEWPATPGSKAPLSEAMSVGRRPAVRIQNTWFLAARGDVLQVHPTVKPIALLAGHAHPDTSILVGGHEKGFLLERAGTQFKRYSINAEGIATLLETGGAFQSPVRAGFDAVEQPGGGVLVAGVSAADPEVVLTFPLDASGKPGEIQKTQKIQKTSLKIEAGELFVRLTALPKGGALLSDIQRTQVIWLDSEGRELDAKPWLQKDQNDQNERCFDGMPIQIQKEQKNWPAPLPGVFVELPEAELPGTCFVSEPMWAADESALKWLGTSENALDSLAEWASVALHFKEDVPNSNELKAKAQGSAPVLGRAEASPCPPEMVSIAGKYCIDRFEAMLVDTDTGEPFSPDYPATPKTLEFILSEWSMGRSRVGNAHARAMPLPFLPRWQRGSSAKPMAVSRMGARPNGYVTGLVAESACTAAGKRLCTLDEFVTACRGENDTLFPYGDSYEEGVCNVFREDHPAAMLHGNASVGHLDPRLNRVRTEKGPLLRETGATPACRSEWGSDAVYDMVGNVDEWVDEEGGAFAGGFYARSTRSGCEALVTAHPKAYLDYSTGVRCCKDGGK